MVLALAFRQLADSCGVTPWRSATAAFATRRSTTSGEIPLAPPRSCARLLCLPPGVRAEVGVLIEVGG